MEGIARVILLSLSINADEATSALEIGRRGLAYAFGRRTLGWPPCGVICVGAVQKPFAIESKQAVKQA